MKNKDNKYQVERADKLTKKDKERILKLGNEAHVLISKIQNPKYDYHSRQKMKRELENIFGKMRADIFEKEFHYQEQAHKLFLSCYDPITVNHKRVKMLSHSIKKNN